MGSWVPAGIEVLPDGWVNVRLYAHDRILGRDLYTTDTCPAVLHVESTVTERVLQFADPNGDLFDNETGEPWDDHPTVVEVAVADPPHRYRYYLDPSWKPAQLGGGYLASCPRAEVQKVLTENGFADAIEKPEGWVNPDDE